jgi:CheY-like chemotaxis protein
MDCIVSGQPCILLAEDNPVNQRVAQRMLKRMGYPVDVAANGLEALQALKRKSYSLILMDIQMPEMDGLEATRIIRQQLSAEEQPRIIAVTAHALSYSREMCLDAGMDDYIAKPIQKDELAEILSRYR